MQTTVATNYQKTKSQTKNKIKKKILIPNSRQATIETGSQKGKTHV